MPASSLSSGFAVLAVLQHLHLLQRDQAAAHHAVEDRQELVDLLLALDDLDDDRQVFRQSQDLRRVQPARVAIAHWAAQDCRSRQVHLARLQHDGFVERLVLVAIIFAEEDAQQYGLVRQLHVQIPLSWFSVAAAMCPSHTANRQRTTDSAMLPPAANHSPSRTRASVCRLKEEKVV